MLPKTLLLSGAYGCGAIRSLSVRREVDRHDTQRASIPNGINQRAHIRLTVRAPMSYKQSRWAAFFLKIPIWRVLSCSFGVGCLRRVKVLKGCKRIGKG